MHSPERKHGIRYLGTAVAVNAASTIELTAISLSSEMMKKSDETELYLLKCIMTTMRHNRVIRAVVRKVDSAPRPKPGDAYG